MSSDPMWKRDANGVEHPTPETLLAHEREQCTEHEKSRIKEHLLTGCVSCSRVRVGLPLSSNALNQLKYMSRYLYYPELQSNQVLFHMQRGEPLTSALTGKRKRKFQAQSRPVRRPQATGRYARKAGLRYVSIPAAFAMFILFMIIVVTLVYALASLGKLPFQLPGQQSNNLYFNQGSNNTGVAPHKTPPTNTVPVIIKPSPSVSSTVGASPTPTVTVTVVKGPAIDYCPPPGYKGALVFICGYGFKVGDKVSLVLDYYGSNTPVIWGSFLVNTRGEFAGLYFYSCKNPPIAIYARDETLVPASVTSNILSTIPVTGCYGPTPTPTPGRRS